MRSSFSVPLLAALAILIQGQAPAAEPAPPPAFLSEIEGHQALGWVAAHNAVTLARLQGDPRYRPLYEQALALAQAQDRIPAPDGLAGQIYNFWQDQNHVRGIWRRTTLDSYRSASPAWSTVIDLDALSKAEHANWVWKGIDCQEPAERRCLVKLSDGGEDAITVREFDLAAGRFVPGGFALSRSKQDVAWENDDTLLVARDWGAGSLTTAGYPFIVKRVKRGQPIEQASLVYQGTASDTTVAPRLMADGDGHRFSIVSRATSFFEFEYRMVTPGGLVLLDLPLKSTLEGLVGGRLIARIDQDWTPRHGGAVAAGSLVSIDPTHPDAPPLTIFTPTATQALDTVDVTRSQVVAAIYDNVRGQGWVFAPTASGWTAKRLALPENVSVDVADTSIHDENAFLDVAGFLDPPQLWLADAATGTAAKIKSMPAKFDAAPYAVDQYEATSTDGTRVPYFVVHRKDMKLDGRNPTLLYAYGGFEVSMTPTYSGALGRLWLDHGGVYVLANIRGGGEFGPRWHEAGLKTKRQHVFDDFASVGRDLFARKITSPERLGIRGGSNGGLLMGVEFTQHPELWHAVIIDVPLLDMMNFETMSAGASWVGEYGSVHDPVQRAFLAKISPLQNLKPGVAYPEPYIFTTTKDDRVGPVHARRFAARMEAMHLPFLYFEQTEGGHAAGANLREKAEEQALEFTYLSRKLMP